MLAFADKFFAVVSAGDIETLKTLYHDDVAVWHNYEEHEQNKEENLETLGSIPRRYDSFDYADARCVAIAGGFLRQHVIHASRNGKKAVIPAILRVYVDEGKVRRIEEYFDRGQLTAALT
ncbi:hypothetical protein CLV47_109126 [Antricoccus suffuscus]|uniref:Ketosteroid isomerase-like protein n=2 Tax=Antricoccus suffuscus TaxID=1629062 RepID=A0A2T0ZYZ1_9ACTN|nr:hypothetical protein CLV47_109126 [Antricoccus suffuscus]